ncbi:hypothetical protein Tco_0654786 [Tanacetum coccineum]|uniref:Uncharacterized protein n=1 Tax=Tanacetum coccineum TaxID=301880 RepID=A0ABQ4X473_9ASTR
MNKAGKTAVQLQSDRLIDEAQAENADFINKLDDNIKKIIKEQTINEQLEAEILTRSSNEAKASHAVAANFSELELKKILIDKIENVEMIRMKIKNPPLDQTEGPREEELEKNLNQQVHQRRRLLSHRESIKKGTNLITRLLANQPIDETTQHHDWFQKPTKPPTPDRDWNKTLPAAHGPIQPWINNLARKEDTRDSFNKLMDTPLNFSTFVMNRTKVDTLTLELLAGPRFKLMKGSCKSVVKLEYFLEKVYKATTDQLDWNNLKGQQYPHDMRNPLPLIPNSQVMKTKDADYGHVKWIEDLVPNTMWNWITVHRNDDKLYTFKEGDYKRLRLQDIEDMLLLLVQGKLTNLTIKERSECFIENVYKKHCHPKACGRSSVSCRKLPKEDQSHKAGHNKDKKNILMRIDELPKFSDGTLNDVRTALDDILKRIRMKYLP